MIYAFTGAQDPIGDYRGRIKNTLLTLDPGSDKILTGACIGIDEAVARLAYEMGFFVYTIVPAIFTKIDHFFFEHCTAYEIMPAGTGYMDRNDVLVNHPIYNCDILYGFPNQREEVLRSGTWATIRRARKTGKEVRIVSPY